MFPPRALTAIPVSYRPGGAKKKVAVPLRRSRGRRAPKSIALPGGAAIDRDTLARSSFGYYVLVLFER
jgi:hypothetical protein